MQCLILFILILLTFVSYNKIDKLKINTKTLSLSDLNTIILFLAPVVTLISAFILDHITLFLVFAISSSFNSWFDFY